jgi:anti-sigma-K factor RskA
VVADWSRRLAPLDDATPDEAPSARVWNRIESRIAAEAAPPVPGRSGGRLGGLAFWRGFAVIAGAACAALVLYIATAPAPAPQIVAVLADSSNEPGWVAVAGPGHGEISVSALRDLGGDTRHSFELWGLAGGAPKPLGLLEPRPGQRLLVSAASLPAAGGTLAVSQEPPGGSPTGLPTGPVMYQGKVLAAPP